MSGDNEMSEEQRQADIYLSSDILSWYTDVPVSSWESMLEGLDDTKLFFYTQWASQMSDNIN